MRRGVLIVGASGMLGRAWVQECRARGVRAAGVGRPIVDLTRPASIDRGIGPEWSHVVNCAAWTDVDGAEADEAGATAVNGAGVAALGERCKRTGAVLVHFGTDYVFDGRASAPYPVDAPLHPAGAYGRSKARGEEAIAAIGVRSLVVRTSWLYAPWGRNFVRTIATLAAQRPALKVVDDQRGRPTSAEHLARCVLDLLDRDALGTFHVTDGGECTWHGFAHEIVRIRGGPCRVDPCATTEFPRPARRPAYSVLDLSKTERVLGAMPSWRDNLRGVLSRLEGCEGANLGAAAGLPAPPV